MAEQKSALVRIGDRVSDIGSRMFAHPLSQIVIILFCIAWFVSGRTVEVLTMALSVLAITLTQMVLNGQYDREAEAHRRDVAMHAKLDELIKATKRARDEMVGIEEQLDEEEIQELREEAKQLVERAARKSGETKDGAAATRAIEQVGDGK